jgi:hypothetical protein
MKKQIAAIKKACAEFDVAMKKARKMHAAADRIADDAHMIYHVEMYRIFGKSK